jgi:hypothetical protein
MLSTALRARSRPAAAVDHAVCHLPGRVAQREAGPAWRARQNGAGMACEWLLIDGSSLAFRAYYGALARTRVSGTDENAVGGFLDRLGRLVADRQPRRLVIAEDWAWRPQWRVDLIADYKAHRVSEPVPPGLVAHLPVITICTGWSILAYDLDTLAIRTR